MNTSKRVFRPRAGMRFQLRGAAFEICFAQYGLVRYAATKGGKVYSVTFDSFEKFQQQGEITVQDPDLHGQDEVNGLPTVTNLKDKELAGMMRRRRYAETAVAELVYPNSIRMLEAWIPVFANVIKDKSPPSARTVSDWVRKYLIHGDDAFKAPERKRGNRSLRFSPEIEMLILEAVDTFLQEEQRDANDVLAFIVGHLAEQQLLTKDESKVAIPSVRTIRRRLNMMDPFLLVRIKKGVVAAEKMARAAGKTISSPRPLYFVQIDTHVLKILVVDPDTGEILGKPYLVCAFDVRTRCVVGIYVSLLPASTAATLGVLKDMVARPLRGLPGGVPIYLTPDNGVEFINSGVVRLVNKLSIIFEPAEKYDPNDKAHVESFFRTLSLFLIQKIKGTTFSNLNARGGYDSEAKAFATLDQIHEYIEYWIQNEYHARPHSMTGRVPIRQWEEETAKAKPLALTKAEADALARRPYRCSINGGRVRVNRLYYYSHALRTLEHLHAGRVTVLMDELDLALVYVEHPFEKGVLIQADSVDPDYTQGLTLWEHEEAQKLKVVMKREDLRALGKYASLLARWQLLQKIQKDSQFARSKIAKLTQGKGRMSKGNESDNFGFQSPIIPPSCLQELGHSAHQAANGDGTSNDSNSYSAPTALQGTEADSSKRQDPPMSPIFDLG